MRLMGFGKAKEVKPLNTDMAVELGADMLSEIVVYSIAAFTVFLEYRRQQRKEERHEDSQNTRLIELENSVRDLSLQVEEQNAQLKSLTRLYHSAVLPSEIKDTKSGTVLRVQKNVPS